jgi:spectinomycin phosphotransferase
VRSKPKDLADGSVADALLDAWSFEARTLHYLPVGAGSYHWEAVAADGTRRFVTVDDLGAKAWLGDTHDACFDGLRDAFAATAELYESGLDFVVAPLRANDGEPLRRLDSRYAVALFPYADGETASWGPYDDEGERLAVVAALAALHLAAVPASLRTTGFELPGRYHLERALRELDRPWSGGPLSEPARLAVRDAAAELAGLLALADRLAAQTLRAGGPWVVTHGEPHRANVVRASRGPCLVDWDTVALGPPERDLWMLVEAATDEAAARYAEATGTPVDDVALDYFRLTWELKDVAEYLNVLRGPHVENEDTLREYEALTRCGTIRETWNRHSRNA